VRRMKLKVKKDKERIERKERRGRSDRGRKGWGLAERSRAS
jgi:hypothetical protein